MATLTNVRSERVRSVRALARRAARVRTGLFLAEGPQVVREALRCRPDTVRDVYVTGTGAARHTGIVAAATAAGIRVHDVSDEVLAAMADTTAPQGVLAVCRVFSASLEAVLDAKPSLLCVLSQVRDPGNAGTVLRGADAAGADAVLVTDASVDVFAPKVVRSTTGSIFHLPVVTGLALAPLVERLRGAGLRVYAADGSGPRLLPEVDLSLPHAWVLGNEAWGLAPVDLAVFDEVVRVPIYGRSESLNLAMAATVCLYASAGARRSSHRG